MSSCPGVLSLLDARPSSPHLRLHLLQPRLVRCKACRIPLLGALLPLGRVQALLRLQLHLLLLLPTEGPCLRFCSHVIAQCTYVEPARPNRLVLRSSSCWPCLQRLSWCCLLLLSHLPQRRWRVGSRPAAQAQSGQQRIQWAWALCLLRLLFLLCCLPGQVIHGAGAGPGGGLAPGLPAPVAELLPAAAAAQGEGRREGLLVKQVGGGPAHTKAALLRAAYTAAQPGEAGPEQISVVCPSCHPSNAAAPSPSTHTMWLQPQAFSTMCLQPA